MFGAILLAASLAACGGGGVQTAPLPLPTLDPASFTFLTSTTSTVAVPVIGTTNAIEGTSTFPIANVVAPVTESISASAFAGVPALSSARRGSEGLLCSGSVGSTGPTGSTAPVTIVYLRFTTPQAVTANGLPGFAFRLPSVSTGASYFLAEYNGSTWTAPAAGPGTVSGSTVSFALTANDPTALSPTAPLLVALYSVGGSSTPTPIPSATATAIATGTALPSGAPTASPSGSPTASPTAAPTSTATATAAPSCIPSPTPIPLPTASASPTPVPTPVVSPASLVFDANAPSSANFTVTETNNTANITGAIVCNATSPTPTPTATPASPFVARLNATSVTPAGGVATFAVTSGNSLGTCTVTVTDARGATATVAVAVNASTIGIFSNARSAR